MKVSSGTCLCLRRLLRGLPASEEPGRKCSVQPRSGPAARRIANEATYEGNGDKPYFLIINEMNRGNLAKIFGELHYLLEYRNEEFNLQYNPEKVFALPPNLFIIGTMSTSDMSTAMVDAAIGHRFRKPSLRANLLNALSNQIEDTNRDFMIGPSYFMKPHAETDDGLEELWKYELMPLLEEQYFWRLKRDQVREKFGLEAMRRKAGALRGPVDLELKAGVQLTGTNDSGTGTIVDGCGRHPR